MESAGQDYLKNALHKAVETGLMNDLKAADMKMILLRSFEWRNAKVKSIIEQKWIDSTFVNIDKPVINNYIEEAIADLAHEGLIHIVF